MDIIDAVAVAEIITGIMVIIVWITGFSFLLAIFLNEKIHERKFYKVVLECLKVEKFKVELATNSVRNAYDVYRRRQMGFGNKKLISVCQDMLTKIRLGKGVDTSEYEKKDEWANRLENVIKQLQYEENFDDEKADEIISLLQSKVDEKSIFAIKQKLVFLEAYHKGVLSVKNTEISELKDKLKRRAWITWISGILGVVGSIASIYSLFN